MTTFFTRPSRPSLAVNHIPGNGPALVFFPGYASDMSGSKAQALRDHAIASGRPCLLFDYAGCGQSAGEFAAETLTSWRDDALDVIAEYAPDRSLILVGSSMGGWLMLLVALALTHSDPGRIAAMLGIAAAPDFTDWGYSDEQKATLARDGLLFEDNPYGPEPTLTTHALWLSGEANRLLGATIPLSCPVRLLHGQADADVPFTISLRLAEQLRSAEVVTTLVKDGDHRLSRPQDIALLLATVGSLYASLEGQSQ
ncbi:alpha/beta hydrolase [Sphingomonas lacunae]|uniref:Palmitoyl-protein thioesterase ABHD10, mitochondrial n=1 Tax=Sphingomonas lacunae TaxID=2698828 RepID=A0A6M4AR04_9SPHN|nr:alpha/beta hydrolase [Sphingomonas lacunae]QJQ31453.1 alpha/beta hydrolase [Sphingomonas lacunae]